MAVQPHAVVADRQPRRAGIAPWRGYWHALCNLCPRTPWSTVVGNRV